MNCVDLSGCHWGLNDLRNIQPLGKLKNFAYTSSLYDLITKKLVIFCPRNNPNWLWKKECDTSPSQYTLRSFKQIKMASFEFNKLRNTSSVILSLLSLWISFVSAAAYKDGSKVQNRFPLAQLRLLICKSDSDDGSQIALSALIAGSPFCE